MAANHNGTVGEHDVPGYEHIETAVVVLKAVVGDLFGLPGAAQQRAITQRELLGEDNHGDDLLCGCWSAAETATALLELAGRHVDAVLHLADAHPGFAPSASVVARAGLEAMLRVAWLTTPVDAVTREQRWIALKREEARFYKNAGTITAEELADRTTELDALAQAVGGATVAGTPSVEALAKEYAGPNVYDLFYRWKSQATHATLVGAGTFDMTARFDWQDHGGEGEWVEAEFWAMPLVACWEGAKFALPAYRDLLAPDHPLPSLARESEFLDAMRSVPPNFQARRDIERKARTAAVTSWTPNRAERRAKEKRARKRQG